MGERTPMILEESAQRFGFSLPVVQHIWDGLVRSHGKQVQFNSPELGGQGQWQNGMLMIGDWNNHSLKARLAELIEQLAPLAAQSPAFAEVPAAQVYARQEQPLGVTDETETTEPEKTLTGGWQGTQNGISYVFYPEQSLLALNSGERYSTAPYFVLGMGQSQQQGRNTLVLLTDQGEIAVDQLTRIE